MGRHRRTPGRALLLGTAAVTLAATVVANPLAPIPRAVADGTAAPPAASAPSAEQPLAALVGPGAVPVAVPLSGDALRTTATATIAVVTTGVDLAALPEPVRERVTALHGSSDPVGWGTLVVSQLLQVAPRARVVVASAYPNGHFNGAWLHNDLAYFAANAASYDAVLYAVPPQAYVDPVADFMSRGTWDALDEAIARYPLTDAEGPVYGVALNPSLRAGQKRGIPSATAALFDTWATLVTRWSGVTGSLDRLRAAGVPVVAPAGDLGAGAQKVLGVAGLPQVVTVGAAAGDTVAATSSGGPALTGALKPDLVAPSGVVGLLPASSSVAKALRATGRLDSSLVPDLPGDVPDTAATTRLASSLSSATVVTAALAGLHAGGVRDVAVARAALAAASTPLAGVPVTRQGAGLLRFAPDAAFATTASLVLGNADFGAEPASGTWAVRLGVRNAVAGAATTRAGEFTGVGPDGRNYSAADEYPVTATATADGVVLTAPAGDESWEGGLYCGYTEVPLSGTSGEADATLRANGVPAGLEQVPTCLLNGSRLRAHAFYIHDEPAENLTFVLQPAIPVGGSLLERPLMLLPANPLDAVFFRRVTGADGFGTFTNLPPGYYRLKLHSDYGVPQEYTVTGVTTGAEITRKRDTGEPLAYQAMDLLAVSAVCGEQAPPATAGSGLEQATPDPCTEQWLVERFGRENVTFEKTTQCYLVRPAPGVAPVRVAFGALKKMVGANVGGRVVDLLTLDSLTAVSADLSALAKRREASSPATAVWTYRGDGDTFTGEFDPLYARADQATQTGVLRYDFALPTPNERAAFDLNFRYSLRNAAVLAVVVVGNEVVAGSVVGGNRIALPAIGAEQPVDPYAVRVEGASGTASFPFKLMPRNARAGTLYLVLLPAPDPTTGDAGLLLAPPRVEIGDLSFELNTWGNTDWPPAATTHGAGHIYTVNANYDARQMDYGRPCRRTTSSSAPNAVTARVCEDWRLFVHSPLNRASTADVLTAGGKSLLADLNEAGALLADSKRPKFGGRSVLAFPDASLAALRARVSADTSFFTNGRFWDQLDIPRQVLAKHPGALAVEVLDIVPGRDSPLFAHRSGHSVVPPYVNFRPAG